MCHVPCAKRQPALGHRGLPGNCVPPRPKCPGEVVRAMADPSAKRLKGRSSPKGEVAFLGVPECIRRRGRRIYIRDLDQSAYGTSALHSGGKIPDILAGQKARQVFRDTVERGRLLLLAQSNRVLFVSCHSSRRRWSSRCTSSDRGDRARTPHRSRTTRRAGFPPDLARPSCPSWPVGVGRARAIRGGD